MNGIEEKNVAEQHPASLWAESAGLPVEYLDCITAVMLKILDGKCKMAQEEKDALIAIYDVTSARKGILFDDQVYQCIEMARRDITGSIKKQIHLLRVNAEAAIPKPVMKSFKAMMREALSSLL
jgi:hypothetical protein